MSVLTQYYGAEIQHVQVEFIVNLFLKSEEQKVRSFVFNQKILAQTFTQKSTQPANKPIPLELSDVKLGYTPIILQRGRGGPTIVSPNDFIKGFFPAYSFTDVTSYDPNGLTIVQSIRSISTSPAGNLIEVATVYNITVSSPYQLINGTEI